MLNVPSGHQFPHHVMQRGNRREPIFLEDGDQEIYRHLLGEQVRKADVGHEIRIETFAVTRGGSVRLKRHMRLKPPPHRGEVCALSALCALSPRIGGFCPSGQEPEGGTPSTPGRGVAVFSRPWLFPSRQTPCSLPRRSHPH